jgi:hypothetical protein
MYGDEEALLVKKPNSDPLQTSSTSLFSLFIYLLGSLKRSGGVPPNVPSPYIINFDPDPLSFNKRSISCSYVSGVYRMNQVLLGSGLLTFISKNTSWHLTNGAYFALNYLEHKSHLI